MKKQPCKYLIVISVLLASAFFANQAAATVLNPAASFTLRSFTNGGLAATSMDATWNDGGFPGYLTNVEGNQVDRSYVEYNMAGFGGPVASATLNFFLSGRFDTDTISLSWYAANGTAELTDWSTFQTPVTTFNAVTQAYAIDITSLINANLGTLSFIGFRFSIVNASQAFLDRQPPPVINFTAALAPVPEPGSLALLGLGLAAAAWSRRRVSA